MNPNYVQQFNPNIPADAAYLERLRNMPKRGYNLDEYHTPPPSNAATGRSLQIPPDVGGTAQMQASPDFGVQVMDLLKRFQQMGTRGFAEQGLNAQQAQVNRTSAETPADLVGASPSLQSSTRNAAVNALDPIVNSAKNSQQTFTEQLTSAKDFLKEIQTQRDKEQDNARTVVNNILTTTDPESLKGLSQDEVNNLEKLAGYPKGFLASAITYKQKQLDNTKTVSYQDLGDRLGVFDNQGNLLNTIAKTTKPGDNNIVDINGTDYVVNADGTYSAPELPASVDNSKLQSAKEIKALAENLKTRAGFGHAVGSNAFFGLGKSIPGTNSAGYLADFDQLKDLIALPNLEKLKGPMSDKDIAFVRSIGTSLNLNMNEAAFKAELDKIIQKMSEIESRATPGTGGESKVINGIQYQKVNGGWQRVDKQSFNSVGNTSASRPVRNANPLNIKFSSMTKTYPGVVGIDPQPASDGGQFLVFNSPEAGFQAAEKLITSANYRDLSVDAALRRWSNNGYGGEIAPSLKSKRIVSLSPAELQSLIRTMAQREGYN